MFHNDLPLTSLTSFNEPQYFDGSISVRTATAIEHDKLIKTWTQ